MTAVMTALFAMGIGRITINNANNNGSARVMRQSNATKTSKIIGSDKFIIFLVPTENAISIDALNRLSQLEEDLSTFTFGDVPAFDDFNHLGNIRYVAGDAFSMEVINPTDGIEMTEEGMAELKKRVERSGQYEGLLYSPDRRWVTLLAEIPIRSDDDKFHAYIARSLRELLGSPPIKTLIFACGRPHGRC